jgi:hypothetical protein
MRPCLLKVLLEVVVPAMAAITMLRALHAMVSTCVMNYSSLASCEVKGVSELSHRDYFGQTESRDD